MSTFDDLYEDQNIANWINYPNVSTPLNQVNLRALNAAIKKLFDGLYAESRDKVTTDSSTSWLKDLSFDSDTGIFTATRVNNTTFTIDTKLEKLAVNFTYDGDPTSAHYQSLIITLDDGTIQYVDMSALLTQYEFVDTTTIDMQVDSSGRVSARIVDHSIGDDQMQTGYLANVTAQAGNAAASAESAAQSASSASMSREDAKDNALLSQSWAVGGTGERQGEDTNNSKFWAEKAEGIYQSLGSALHPMGTITFANLPDFANVEPGYMYNISDAFTSDSRFRDGSGFHYDRGANVYAIQEGSNWYWDVLTPVDMSGKMNIDGSNANESGVAFGTRAFALGTHSLANGDRNASVVVPDTVAVISSTSPASVQIPRYIYGSGKYAPADISVYVDGELVTHVPFDMTINTTIVRANCEISLVGVPSGLSPTNLTIGYRKVNAAVPDKNLMVAKSAGALARGDNSFASGLAVDAFGQASIATGIGTYAYGNASQACGARSKSRADYSMAIGEKAITKRSDSVQLNNKMFAIGAVNSAKDGLNNTFKVESSQDLGNEFEDTSNVMSVDSKGNMFLRGFPYLVKGVVNNRLIANGDYFVLEDGAAYILYTNTRMANNGAWRGAQAYYIVAPFAPQAYGVGASTTALGVAQHHQFSSIGTAGLTLKKDTVPYTVSTTSGDKTYYHARIGIGSCVANCCVRYSLIKVVGSEADFATNQEEDE